MADSSKRRTVPSQGINKGALPLSVTRLIRLKVGHLLFKQRKWERYPHRSREVNTTDSVLVF